MTAAFDPQRAVAVFGPVSYGSGYRVTSALVLTACHLFGDDPRGTAKVRDPRGRGGSARVARASPRLDLALLELGPPEEGGLSPADDLPPAAIGRLSRSPGVTLPFEMFGWARAGAARDDAGAWIRDPVHVVGEIRANELMGTQSRLVRLRPADRFPALADGSWWSGMSGAGVFCGGLLVGVQVRQARPELPDFLAAQAIEGDEAGELIALLRAAGVIEEVALDPDARVVDGYLSRLGGRLDALPT